MDLSLRSARANAAQIFSAQGIKSIGQIITFFLVLLIYEMAQVAH
jgi:hypothetical protein